MDANDNVYASSLAKELTNPVRLDLKEVIGATYFWGLKQINDTWASSDLDITSR